MIKAMSKGNPSGSIRIKNLLHAQRIAGETTLVEYNPATSHRHLEQVMMYAELIGNYKKQGIKSPCGNKLRFQAELADIEVSA